MDNEEIYRRMNWLYQQMEADVLEGLYIGDLETEYDNLKSKLQ